MFSICFFVNSKYSMVPTLTRLDYLHCVVLATDRIHRHHLELSTVVPNLSQVLDYLENAALFDGKGNRMRQFYPWMLDELLGNPAMLHVLIMDTDIKTLMGSLITKTLQQLPHYITET
jgi:hypothetical protein